MKRIFLTALSAFALANAATITVDPSDTKQRVVGFGAGMAYYQNWVTALSNTTQEAFYDTAFTGLNLSLLRMGNWLQEADHDLSSDVKIVQAAKKRLGSRLKIEMSSWSAPGNLKPSGSVNGKDGGGDKSKNTLNKSANDPYGSYAYKEFAEWWKTSYLAYQELGIAPDYISFQNEPDMNADYEETLFEPKETSEIAGYAEALKAVADAFSTLENPPKIIGPEPLGIGYNNFQKYARELDHNLLGGYAYHIYHAGDGNDQSDVNYLNPENFRPAMTAIGNSYGSDEKPLIMTEFCNMLGMPRESDMVGLAHIMQAGFSSGNLSGYIAWELFWGETDGQLITVCTKGWGGCSEDKITINPEYHAMRHYSKFVAPYSRVVSSMSDTDGLLSIAFRSVACDSVTVIAINTTNTAQNLTAPLVAGYTLIDAVESVENGEKSQPLSATTNYAMKARSIITFVYKNAGTTNLSCEDAPIENTVKPVGKESYVVVDFTAGDALGKWTTDVAVVPNEITLETDGSLTYAKVPLANCAQDECGYQHAIFSLPATAIANDVLATCSELELTLRGIEGLASINVGGAGGSEWVNYQYGVQAGADWQTVSVYLTNEAGMGSTQITFNSDNAGFYLAKIEAKGCGSEALAKPHYEFSHGEVKIFDLNGNFIQKGAYSQMIGEEGVRANLPAGAYIVKTGGATFKAIRK